MDGVDDLYGAALADEIMRTEADLQFARMAYDQTGSGFDDQECATLEAYLQRLKARKTEDDENATMALYAWIDADFWDWMEWQTAQLQAEWDDED